MSFETKAFGAFVRQLAKAGLKQALPLEAFVRRPGDGVREVRREIDKSVARGLMTAERVQELQRLIDVLMAWHRTHGYVQTHLDSADWMSLGDGGHWRRKHLDENYEAPVFKGMPSSIEEKLEKETEDEEE